MRQLFSTVLISLLTLLVSWNLGWAYEVVDVQSPAQINGTITFTGKALTPRTFEVKKNPEICGVNRSLTKVSVKDGKLQGAVIILEGVTQGKAFQERRFQADSPGEGEFYYRAGEKLSLDVQTKNCNFGPFTGVLAQDEPIRFSNEDPVKHTLHTYVKRGTKATVLKTVHNRGIQPAKTIEETFTAKKLKSPGVVAITCDRHDFMENWLYVVDSPYFAISDEKGQFNIDRIPPGHYTLVAWHPVLGTQKQEVTITPQGTLQVHFEFVKK